MRFTMNCSTGEILVTPTNDREVSVLEGKWGLRETGDSMTLRRQIVLTDGPDTGFVLVGTPVQNSAPDGDAEEIENELHAD